MEFNQHQAKHILLMKNILEEITKRNLPMCLKGGTALLLCYNLDRFSEDIDLDSDKKINLENVIASAIATNKMSGTKLLIKKDTDTVKRYILLYDKNKRLKIEISLRNKIDKKSTIVINGIRVYNVQKIINMKLQMIKNFGTFKNNKNQGRRKARDLHDIIYLGEKYYDSFTAENILDLNAIANNDNLLFEFIEDYNNDNILKDKFFSDIEKLKNLTTQSRDVLIEDIFKKDIYITEEESQKESVYQTVKR